MKTITYRIQMPLNSFGLNTLVNENRYSKFGANNTKKKVQKQVAEQIKLQGAEIIQTPCEIKVLWLVKNKARDIDNLLLKNILDALQSDVLFKEKLLVNDNLNHVHRITHDHLIVSKENEGLIIEFIPLEKEESIQREKTFRERLEGLINAITKNVR